MGYVNFGYTWWGNKWLDALLSTDYSNRLPRGKRYARNGSVKSIYIANEYVASEVQGSRRRPYDIDFSLKKLTSKEKTNILDIVIDNPLYLSSLLNRKLPEQLYQEFKQKNIELFPRRWSDINANCSCPDWAECCKHIAATIYLIANEIDKNPFLVFELRGMNIFAELEQKGFILTEKDQENIKHISQLFEKSSNPKKIKDKKINTDFDFMQIPCFQDQLLSLLDEEPLFFPGQNFKKILQKIYFGMSKKAIKLHEIIGLPLEPTNILEKANKVTIDLNDTLDEKIFIEIINKGKKVKQNIDIALLQSMLLGLPLKKISHLSNEVQFLYVVINFSLKLLQQGAFIPEIIAISENCYKIRYLPALFNKKVSKLFKQIVLLIPFEIIKFQIKQFSLQSIKQEEKLKLLISLFLEHFISEYSYDLNWLNLAHPISSLFFARDILETKSFEAKELPVTIAIWLSKFYITHKEYIPLLKVEETKQNFEISILVENQKKPLDAPIPLLTVFSNNKYQSIALSLFKDLQLLEIYFPEIGNILTTKGSKRVVISSELFPDVLFKQLPILKMLGIPILLPKGLEEVIRPKISLSINKKSNGSTNGASYLSLSELLDFNWEIAFGNERINLNDFKKLLKESQGIVKIKDQYVYFDEKEMQKLLKTANQDPKISNTEKIRLMFSEKYKGTDINLSQTVQNMLKKIHTVKKVSLPETLKATLRPYQLRGYEWLYKNTLFGFGSLIADDMGLGKTIQVIAYLLKIKSEDKLLKHPALVIVPTTLLTNWKNEINKFAPDLNVHIYHGSKRELYLKKQDLLITSYGLVRRDNEKFSKFKWPVLIIDEAQNIKNHNTDQTKVIKKLRADIRIAMTGTPVENRLSEYWSIIDFLNKGYLSNQKNFKKEFALPIEVDRNQEVLKTFKKVTDPFILRRIKTDKSIITDLPDKIEIDQFNQLSKQQIALYQSVLDNIMAQIEHKEGIDRKGLIFKLMTSLKQICNHPSHFQKKKNISPELSGKTGVLMELLDTIYENEEKVLIFTQYTDMGQLLQTLIEEKYKRDIIFFHGGLSRKKRDEMVDQFQNDLKLNTMILSLKAGGTGLNLTAARHVIHFDLWWNPAVEAQATDRAYRIGQKENVMVYRMITKNTFEEKINDMLKKKKELANLTVSNGEKWIGQYSNQELKDIFELNKHR